MDPRERSALRRNHKLMVDGIPMGRDLLDHLYTAKVFTAGMIEDIESNRTDANKINQMLKLLPKRGPKAFEKFVAILEEICPWLANQLRRSLEEPRSSEVYKRGCRSMNNRPQLQDSSCSPMPQSDYARRSSMTMGNVAVDETDSNPSKFQQEQGSSEIHPSSKSIDKVERGEEAEEEEEEEEVEEEEEIESHDGGETLETDMISRSPSTCSMVSTDSQNNYYEEKPRFSFDRADTSTAFERELIKELQAMEAKLQQLEAEKYELEKKLEMQAMFRMRELKEKENLQNYYISNEDDLQRKLAGFEDKVKEQLSNIEDLEQEKLRLERKVDQMVQDNCEYSKELKMYRRKESIEVAKIKAEIEKEHKAEIMKMTQQHNESMTAQQELIDRLQKRVKILEGKDPKTKHKKSSLQRRQGTTGLPSSRQAAGEPTLKSHKLPTRNRFIFAT